MFSCEFFEIFKNTFFIEHLRWLLLSKDWSCRGKKSNDWFLYEMQHLARMG